MTPSSIVTVGQLAGAHSVDGFLRDTFQWDVRNWSQVLDLWLPILTMEHTVRPRALLLGERDGGLSLLFASLGAEVVCSDRTGPTPAAEELHRRYGVADSITYAEVDIFEIPHADATFDFVSCKSVIGGLKREYGDKSTRTLSSQQEAVSEIFRVLQPGGWFLGAENLSGSPLHRALRYLRHQGTVGWRHLTTTELAILFEAFTPLEVVAYGLVPVPEAGLISSAIEGFNRLASRWTAKDWQYIGFVRAQKPMR